MRKFEIITRHYPNTVVRTVEFEDFRAFRAFWLSAGIQKDYDYREIDPPAAPVCQPSVINQRLNEAGEVIETETFPLSDSLLGAIASQIDDVHPGQVHFALTQGQAIYTPSGVFLLQ